jgi:hypothetical protein
VGEGEVVIYKSKNYACIALFEPRVFEPGEHVQILTIHFGDLQKDTLSHAINYAKYNYHGDLAIFDKNGNYYPIKK